MMNESNFLVNRVMMLCSRGGRVFGLPRAIAIVFRISTLMSTTMNAALALRRAVRHQPTGSRSFSTGAEKSWKVYLSGT